LKNIRAWIGRTKFDNPPHSHRPPHPQNFGALRRSMRMTRRRISGFGNLQPRSFRNWCSTLTGQAISAAVMSAH